MHSLGSLTLTQRKDTLLLTLFQQMPMFHRKFVIQSHTLQKERSIVHYKLTNCIKFAVITSHILCLLFIRFSRCSFKLLVNFQLNKTFIKMFLFFGFHFANIPILLELSACASLYYIILIDLSTNIYGLIMVNSICGKSSLLSMKIIIIILCIQV